MAKTTEEIIEKMTEAAVHELAGLNNLDLMASYLEMNQGVVAKLLQGYMALVDSYNQLGMDDPILSIMPYAYQAKHLWEIERFSTLEELCTEGMSQKFLEAMKETANLILKGQQERQLGSFAPHSPNIGIASSSGMHPEALIAGTIGHILERLMFRSVGFWQRRKRGAEGVNYHKDDFLHAIDNTVLMEQLVGSGNLVAELFTKSAPEGIGWVRGERIPAFAQKLSVLIDLQSVCDAESFNTFVAMVTIVHQQCLSRLSSVSGDRTAKLTLEELEGVAVKELALVVTEYGIPNTFTMHTFGFFFRTVVDNVLKGSNIDSEVQVFLNRIYAGKKEI